MSVDLNFMKDVHYITIKEFYELLGIPHSDLPKYNDIINMTPEEIKEKFSGWNGGEIIEPEVFIRNLAFDDDGNMLIKVDDIKKF